MRNPVVFDWLKAHTVIAEVVIIIMMAVLLFNMAAAMLIMVFDRIGMIGALKAQGMRSAAIRRIFLYRAAILFVRGAVWGNAVGGALVAMQALWHPIKLDPTGYMLSVLPVSVSATWWILLNVATLAATIAVMVLPSAMVARIRPEESLKYKL
jgi:lipoprotein-releasing system permease protein